MLLSAFEMNMKHEILHGDCLEIMRTFPDGHFDLVFCSPPYEAARTYGIDFKLRGQAWVDWCVERYLECVRVCRGLVAWVVEGQTRNYRYSAAPLLLMADLHRAGVNLRKPPIFSRIGIPGSGGPDWLRNDFEFVVCATQPGKLLWSDNTAMGHIPKMGSCRTISVRKIDGTRQKQRYVPPKKANPGNIIRCIVGGGVMGSKLCHENEAPFPESLAEFFVRSFCPLGGKVLDPFCGSGTTLAVAKRTHRCGTGIDIRESQVDLMSRRIGEVQPEVLDE